LNEITDAVVNEEVKGDDKFCSSAEKSFSNELKNKN
jgi:hypothetical protein